jgi:2-furoyl-CoA dehydrogenase 2Fe-2S iron sulfur subunit
MDGRAERACLTFAVQADGHEIVTIEGHAEAGELNDLQQAFSEHGALQCGYCTPGILASCAQFLAENPEPDESAVRDMLSGHICRCTGYVGMVRAVLDTAARRRSGV